MSLDTSTTRPRRSALYMPASNARAIEKARDLPCDVVILDLEDAVAPDAKDLARQQAVDAVRAGGFGRREVVIRVNALSTPWGADDLAAAVAAAPDAILAPKVSSADDVRAYAREISGQVRFWAMIETCAAVFRLPEIAASAGSTPLEAWVIGSNDLAKEMRCRLDVERAALASILTLSVAAARAEGLAILDGVFNDIEDDDGLARQCAQGLDYGFDGKSLIHPRQVAVANQVFTPTAEEVRWSQVIVDAFALPENATRGVLRVEGRMVERLHLHEAQRVLRITSAIAD